MQRKILTIVLVALLTINFTPMYTASATITEESKEYFSAQDFIVPLPANEWWKPIPLPEENLIDNDIKTDIMDQYEDVPVTIDVLVPIGTYYITAYCACSKCCWPSTNMTASGTVCHYEDDSTVPSTCAIDRSLHHFGDTFYLKSEGRMYVAEDTGSAVKGKHIDIYFPDHSYVQSYGSHYETVYTVKSITLDASSIVDFNQFNEIDISYKFDYYRKSNTELIKDVCPKKNITEESIQIE